MRKQQLVKVKKRRNKTIPGYFHFLAVIILSKPKKYSMPETKTATSYHSPLLVRDAFKNIPFAYTKTWNNSEKKTKTYAKLFMHTLRAAVEEDDLESIQLLDKVNPDYLKMFALMNIQQFDQWCLQHLK
jgi:hypothetical protein